MTIIVLGIVLAALIISITLILLYRMTVHVEKPEEEPHLEFDKMLHVYEFKPGTRYLFWWEGPINPVHLNQIRDNLKKIFGDESHKIAMIAGVKAPVVYDLGEAMQFCTRPAPHICKVDGPCNGLPREEERVIK